MRSAISSEDPKCDAPLRGRENGREAHSIFAGCQALRAVPQVGAQASFSRGMGWAVRGWGWMWEEAMDHLKREEAEEPLQESFPCQAPALSSPSILEVLPADFSPAFTFF